MTSQLWVLNSASPWGIERAARTVEELGYAGMAVTDSQNLSGDSVVSLSLAATVTKRIGLSTAVTNPFTRHPASLAAAFASLQVITGGRMVLGIGRGDSALALLGLAPASLKYFESTLTALSCYLSGADVSFDDLPQSGIASASRLNLGDRQMASRFEWLEKFPDVPTVPVDVYASGPKMIRLAIRCADRVTLAVGADPERIKWARSIALDEAERIGKDIKPDTIGALVNLSVGVDTAAALAKAAGRLAVVMRFTAMHGKATGPYDDEDRRTVEQLVRAYSMKKHSQVDASHAAAIRPEFADRFGLFGTAEHCANRLRGLEELGISRFAFMAPGIDVDENFDSIRALSKELNLVGA